MRVPRARSTNLLAPCIMFSASGGPGLLLLGNAGAQRLPQSRTGGGEVSDAGEHAQPVRHADSRSSAMTRTSSKKPLIGPMSTDAAAMKSPRSRGDGTGGLTGLDQCLVQRGLQRIRTAGRRRSRLRRVSGHDALGTRSTPRRVRRSRRRRRGRSISARASSGEAGRRREWQDPRQHDGDCARLLATARS